MTMRTLACETTTRSLGATDGGGDVTTYEVTATTSAVDRSGDIVEPAGGQFDNWRRAGAPVNFAHDTGALPIARAVGLVPIANGWRMKFQFLQGDPFAQRAENAWVQGALGGASIGFQPLEYSPLPGGGMRFTEWELVEVSLTSTPCNPEATKICKGLARLASASRVSMAGARHSAADMQMLSTIHDCVRGLGSPCPMPGDDDIDLDVTDDDDIDISSLSARDVNEAFAGGVRSAARAVFRRGIGDPLADPSARGRRNVGDINITPAEVRDAVRGVIASVLGDRQHLAQTVRNAVHAHVRKRRGRLD